MATSTTSYWFSPSPSDMSSSRVSLDFGLRSADLAFRELVVPQLGRVWFVRQLSWPLAAIALHEELRGGGANAPKPTAICHAIEALACKMEFFAHNEPPSGRILGSRAFGRDPDGTIQKFGLLRRASNYVVNTHRQAATRAIRVDGGLGFASGSRFDLFELEPVGRALAAAFLDQKIARNLGGTLRNWLHGWLDDESRIPWDANSLRSALSPDQPSKDEKALVSPRLLGTLTKECRKRKRLADAMRRTSAMPRIEEDVVPQLRSAGYETQAAEIIAARAFGAMLDRARDVIAALTEKVEPARGGMSISQLTRDKEVRKKLEIVREAANRFIAKIDVTGFNEPQSRAFATELSTSNDSKAILYLSVRSGEVLGVADHVVIRGGLFRVVSGAESLNEELENSATSIEPDSQSQTGRTFRIANFHALLRDIASRGAA